MSAEAMKVVAKDIENLRESNFANGYIDGARIVSEKWAKTGLLNGLDDPFVLRNIAIILENQARFSEETGGGMNPAFYSMSLAIVRRVFDPQRCPLYRLISVQSFISPNNIIYRHDKRGFLVGDPAASRTRKWDTSWQFGNDVFGVDQGDVVNFANSLLDEMCDEVVKDLAQHAGARFRRPWTDEVALLEDIDAMSESLDTKNSGNWVVTSPEVIGTLKDSIAFNDSSSHLSLNHRGVLAGEYDVFESKIVPKNLLLMGFKNEQNHYDAGYAFCPYIFCTMLDQGVCLARYAKRLFNPAAFAVLQLDGLPEIEAEVTPPSLQHEGGVPSDSK